MTLPTRSSSAVTERAGVNFVRTVVEAEDCIFHEVHHEADYGIDALLELVEDQKVTGRCVALQIKAGASYSTRNVCRTRHTAKQATYWTQHSLPVLGIVYEAEEGQAFWIDLVSACEPEHAGVVEIPKNRYHRFDRETFRLLVLPLLFQRTPEVDFDAARDLAMSDEYRAHSTGLRTLLWRYADRDETWRVFEAILLERAAAETDPFLVYAIAHIPWHGDISFRGSHGFPEVRRETETARMKTWGREHVLALVRFIDENEMQRGAPGQSVYAIVDLTIADAAEKLRSIVGDAGLPGDDRRKALMLYCYVEQERSAPCLEALQNHEELGPMASIALEHLRAGRRFPPLASAGEAVLCVGAMRHPISGSRRPGAARRMVG